MHVYHKLLYSSDMRQIPTRLPIIVLFHTLKRDTKIKQIYLDTQTRRLKGRITTVQFLRICPITIAQVFVLHNLSYPIINTRTGNHIGLQ